MPAAAMILPVTLTGRQPHLFTKALATGPIFQDCTLFFEIILRLSHLIKSWNNFEIIEKFPSIFDNKIPLY